MRARTTLGTDSLEDRITAIVDARIAARLGVLGAGGPITYSTAAGAWPPGCRSRRQARDRIACVPGRECIGRGRATTWVVSRDAYDRHHARAVPPVRLVPAQLADDEAIAGAALAGWRATSAPR